MNNILDIDERFQQLKKDIGDNKIVALLEATPDEMVALSNAGTVIAGWQLAIKKQNEEIKGLINALADVKEKHSSELIREINIAKSYQDHNLVLVGQLSEVKKAFDRSQDERDQYQADKRGQRIYIAELEKSRNEITAHNLALVEENGKLKADVKNWKDASTLNKVVADNRNLEITELENKVEKLRADQDELRVNLSIAQSDRDCFKQVGQLNFEGYTKVNQTLAERELEIKYLHKAIDAQQKALDKLREGDATKEATHPYKPAAVPGDNPDRGFDPVHFDREGRIGGTMGDGSIAAAMAGLHAVLPGVSASWAHDQAKRAAVMNREQIATRGGTVPVDLSGCYVSLDEAGKKIEGCKQSLPGSYCGQRERHILEILELIIAEVYRKAEVHQL